MNPTQVFAISLILLLICTGIESYRIQKRESPESTYLSQAQEVLTSTWENVSSKVQELAEKARARELEDKVKEYYEKVSGGVKTYTHILFDQAYHWWYNN